MKNEEIKRKYPIQDDIWPSRRWNKDRTEYCDLSGHEDYENCVAKAKPICLNPRNESDNCDRKEPCKECEGCPHFAEEVKIVKDE